MWRKKIWKSNPVQVDSLSFDSLEESDYLSKFSCCLLWILSKIYSWNQKKEWTIGSLYQALVVQNPPAKAGGVRDALSFPGSGRSPEGGCSNPLQESSLENPCQAPSPRGHRVGHDWNNLACMQAWTHKAKAKLLCLVSLASAIFVLLSPFSLEILYISVFLLNDTCKIFD